MNQEMNTDTETSSSSSSDDDEEEGEEGEEEREEEREEEQSDFEDDNENEDRQDCNITNNLVMPKLTISCLKQHLPNGKKCFRNKCLEVTKLISVSDETSTMGNIVQVANDDNETYIVKWNRYRDTVAEFKYEVRIQKAAFSLGIAPQILQVYEQESERSSGGYIYIFMTDLIKLGYKSISEFFGIFKNGKQVGFKKYTGEKDDIPRLAIIEIAKTLKKLHSIGIAHKDLHPGNVFTNGRKIMLIDFGLSEMYANSGDAWRHEHFSSTRHFVSDEGTPFTHLLPNNWKDIKALSKPYK